MNLNKIILCLSISILGFSMMGASVAADQTVNVKDGNILTNEKANQIVLDMYERGETVGVDEYGDPLVELKIPTNFTAIDDEAFQYADILKALHVTSNIKTIGYMAFNQCKRISKLIIDNGVEHIDEGAFSVCEDLKNVVIPDSVKTIGESAFCSCTHLENVTLGKGVEAIGDGAFLNCDNLKSIKVYSEDVKKMVINSFAYSGKSKDLSVMFKTQQDRVKKIIEVIQ